MAHNRRGTYGWQLAALVILVQAMGHAEGYLALVTLADYRVDELPAGLAALDHGCASGLGHF